MQHPTVLSPEAHITYSPEHMSKATLFVSERLLVGLNGFEPGQEHKLHAHDGMDKLYLVLAGQGTVLFEQHEEPIGPGQAVIAPAGVPHGLRNTGPDRLLVLAALAPAPGGLPKQP